MKYFYLTILSLLLPLLCYSQSERILSLPNGEQLSSGNVLHLMQDSEGFLWYATEGGGICRNSGLGVDVFRSDADHPTVLGSNDVGCLAEVGGKIVIGTFRGAYVLDKKDFSISQLPDVFSNRIDDIMIGGNGNFWLTANKIIYEYSSDCKLLNTYPSEWNGKGVYVAYIVEDFNGDIWATQWDGGLVKLNRENNSFEAVAWTVGTYPTAIVSDSVNRCLWIGTVGQGIVKYNPENCSVMSTHTGDDVILNNICIDLLLTPESKRLWMSAAGELLCFNIIKGELERTATNHFLNGEVKALNRLEHDHNGNLLVAGSQPGPFVVVNGNQESWFDNTIADGSVTWKFRQRLGLTCIDNATDSAIVIPNPGRPLLNVMSKRKGADGIWITDGASLVLCTAEERKTVAQLSEPPTAMADDGRGGIWISTDFGLYRYIIDADTMETVSKEYTDISAMTIDADSCLWIGTVFGKLYRYDNGKLIVDEYASEGNDDAIIALNTDSDGRLVIVFERYVQLYDVKQKTLRQQTRAASDTYKIELCETKPNERWSNAMSYSHNKGNASGGVSLWWIGAACLCLLSLLAAVVFLRKRKKDISHVSVSPQPHEDNNIQQEQTEQPGQQGQPVAEETSDMPVKEDEDQSPFIQKATAFIDENLSNESYNVEQLSNDMCMSRMTFYRRIHAITGLKPTEFIRNIRLRRAAAMLQEGNLTITEISYATGFSSVSYFSRCFRTMYGVPPTLFGKTNTPEDLAPSDTPS